VILNGKRIVGTVGRATRTDRLGAVPEARVTASNHIPREAGQARGVGRRAPSAPPRERGAAQPTPRARTSPPPFPAEGLLVTSALPHAFLSGTRFHSFRSACAGSARAWREPQASALEAVEKVVTTPKMAGGGIFPGTSGRSGVLSRLMLDTQGSSGARHLAGASGGGNGVSTTPRHATCTPHGLRHVRLPLMVAPSTIRWH
jgi:hypothetical protein